MMSRKSIITVVAVVGLVAGIYLLFVLFAPRFASNGAAEAAASEPKDDRIIIPSVDINTPYFTGGTEVLKKGAWHRFPERGNPKQGGNFILSAHRFVMSYNPIKTMKQSYFYNFNKISEGDKIVVHWQGGKYEYKVSKKYTVKPDQTEIESTSENAKLTVYTCTRGGSYDGREVLEANPVY
jgi:LPXTG-site transpeptidase (sortase) family protein